MSLGPTVPQDIALLALTDAVVGALRKATVIDELVAVIECLAHEMTFRHYALVDHEDLSIPRAGRVDLKRYPPAIVEHLFARQHYRRDPVIRGCAFAGGAFLWSDLSSIITLDRHDRRSLERGAREGLNEGITVPYVRLGDRVGSCTFAGISIPERAPAFLGIAQMTGIFAFQAARRIVCDPQPAMPPPRLHPRPRDCVVLAGCGCSNKQIARALALTPRTVDGYLTEARRLFAAHDRTELVVSAVLAGEVGLDELRRQPG